MLGSGRSLGRWFRVGAAGAALLVADGDAFAQPVWEFVGSPPGAATQELTYDAGSGRVYAGVRWDHKVGGGLNAGAVFVSTDQGRTWARTSPDLGGRSPRQTRVEALLVLPDGTVLAGLRTGGIVRSTDHGQTWLDTAGPIDTSTVLDLLRESDGSLLGLTDTGLVRSLDAGASWALFGSGLPGTGGRALLRVGTRLIAATPLGVYSSLDAGATWQISSSGIGSLSTDCLALGPDGVIWLGGADGLYRSTTGETWQPVPGGFSGALVTSIAAAPGAIAVGTASGIWASSDGVMWTLGGAPAGAWSPVTAVRDILALPSGALLAGSFVESVCRSEDAGQSWQPSAIGLDAGNVKSLTFDQRGRLYVGTRHHGLARTDDLGLTWLDAQFRDQHVFCVRAAPWGDVFLGMHGVTSPGNSNHCWRTTDGEAWTALNNGLIAFLVAEFAFGDPGQVYAAVGWSQAGVYSSPDNGATWTNIGPTNAMYGLSGNHTLLCVFRAASGDMLTAGEGMGVWRRPAGAQAWEYTGLNVSTGVGQQFAVLETPTGVALALHDSILETSPGMYRSTDGGAPGTWQPVGDILDRMHAIVQTREGTLYAAAMDTGVWRSTDQGATWQAVNVGLPTGAAPHSLTIGPDGRLYAGVSGWGVFRTQGRVVGCPPDLTTNAIPGTPGFGQADGMVTNDDFFYYLLQFAAGNLVVADLTTTAVAGQPGYGVPSGAITNDDFFYYLIQFAGGC